MTVSFLLSVTERIFMPDTGKKFDINGTNIKWDANF